MKLLVKKFYMKKVSRNIFFVALFFSLTNDSNAQFEKVAAYLDSISASFEVKGIDNSTYYASGIIIDKNYILTNAHPFKEFKKGIIRNTIFKISQEFTVNEFEYIDWKSDIALLKLSLPIKNRPVLFSNNIQKGQQVFTMGNPDNFENSFSVATVSGFRIISNGYSAKYPYIQLNDLALGGNSGGVVADNQGNVLGMMTLATNKKMSLAIPSSSLSTILFDRVKFNFFESKDLKVTYSEVYRDLKDTTTGILSLWTNCKSCQSEVYVDGKSYGRMEKFFISTPRCNQDGLKNIRLTLGDHLLIIKDMITGEVIKEQLVTINFKNECVLKQVNL